MVILHSYVAVYQRVLIGIMLHFYAFLAEMRPFLRCQIVMSPSPPTAQQRGPVN